MMEKKKFLSNIINLLCVVSTIKFLRSYFVKEIRILAYHRVCDLDKNFHNDPELTSATIKQFEEQVLYIKENYNPIDFKTLKKHIDNKLDLPPNSVIITFDDGFADNYYNAYTILKKFNVPATIFVSTNYMDKDETFWFNRIYNKVLQSPGKNLKIDSINLDITISDFENEREKLAFEIIDKVKYIDNSERVRVMSEIDEVLPVFEQDALSRPLSWEQIKEMNNNMIEVGSHTMSHPVLSSMTSSDINSELVGSKSKIEEELNEDILSISFPVGRSFAFNEDVLSQTKNAGYEFGVTYVSGTNYIKNLNKFKLKRIHIERYIDMKMFKTMLCFPEIFKAK